MKSVRKGSYTQQACESCSHVYCYALQPILSLFLYGFLFFVVHEVFRPSGRLPLVAPVEVELRESPLTGAPMLDPGQNPFENRM